MGSGSASVRVRAHRRRGEEVSASDIRRAKKEEHARQRGLSGAMVGPEELEVLQKKLYPGRFPGMSGRMAAILGYILDKKWTDPFIDEMVVTSDGFMMASNSNTVGANAMIGTISDLQRNWEALLDAADLTLEERVNAERLFAVKIEDHRLSRDGFEPSYSLGSGAT